VFGPGFLPFVSGAFCYMHHLFLAIFTPACPKSSIKIPKKFLCDFNMFLDTFVNILHVKIGNKKYT
jgi:hypothetical protein